MHFIDLKYGQSITGNCCESLHPAGSSKSFILNDIATYRIIEGKPSRGLFFLLFCFLIGNLELVLVVEGSCFEEIGLRIAL